MPELTLSRTLTDVLEQDAISIPTLNAELCDADRNAAWVVHVNLRTRITTAPLRYLDGDEATALTSVANLFRLTRDTIVEHGPYLAHFTALAELLLNHYVRPFTGYWHGQSTSGALDRQDQRRRFRQDLRRLQSTLVAFADSFGLMASGYEVVYFDRPASTEARPDLNGLTPASFLGPRAAAGLNPDMAPEQNYVNQRRIAAFGADSTAGRLGGLGPADDAGGNGRALPSSCGAIGLSLSGGGIRSATFCLGVVQSLARHKVFADIDYLSTVSGGGYLGAFLSAHLSPAPGADINSDRLLVESEPGTSDTARIRALRNDSKYLLSRSLKERFQSVTELIQVPFPIGNTLHEWYRKRLARAFLRGLETVPMSKLGQDSSAAPLLIVNAAVNVPASRDPELRGRDSDFFSFTPYFCGSPITGYCETTDMERQQPDVTLACAMAVSGAALSSHSGMQTNRFVKSATALTGFSLGYWITNPRKVAGPAPRPGFAGIWSRLKELTGLMRETDDAVHVSDGGHIENLGLYELLRRRCKFIIAVDGECDVDRECGALIKASRLGYIDLGVDIDIELSELAIDADGLSQSHFAFGTIHYGDGDDGRPETGYLLYIKSSLTGNEPDYIKEYRRRYPSFPHQTTADQLFEEDQFEAYRALGEHVMDSLFGSDMVTASELATIDHRSRAWLTALFSELSPDA
ncbi:MAG: patatin-like phospholipase family protein [Pseudomonadota bacterium]